jgi:putative transposase
MSRQDNQPRERERTPNNRTTSGFRISDDLWAVLQPLLPVHVNTHRFGGGRPRVPDRACADAIFFVLRTGCQWQALDQTELCPHSTAHDRFQTWVEAGVFLKLWQAGVERFDELCGIKWDWLAMDGAMTKAPLGGEKNRAQSHRPEQVRRQAEPPDGGAWSANRLGGGRGQPS